MYDAIIAGARVAGASTALLLARRGLRVLLLDRAAFPSDTLSTHLIQSAGVALLAKWGLLDRLKATGCPAIAGHRMDYGTTAIAGIPEPDSDGFGEFYAPRRTVLDNMLIDAAVAAGVEFREQCAVENLLYEGSTVTGVQGRYRGTAFQERARITVGADGRRSLIAKLVSAPVYDALPSLGCCFYSYWSGMDGQGLDAYIRPGRTLVFLPTNDGLTMGAVMAPVDKFAEMQADTEGAFQRYASQVEGLPERLEGARRVGPYFGTADQQNFYRRPYGDGWALVGDAGHHKDACTAQGIWDAFRHSELLADAIAEGSGDALRQYEAVRNSSTRARYEMTCQIAKQEGPPAHVLHMVAALQGNQRQTRRFLGVMAGTVEPADFFSPANMEDIFHQAGTGTSG